jgi:hypothetical protein
MKAGVLFVLVLGAFAGVWWYLSPAITGPRLPDVIDESSGLVASRQHPGVFWTHNDSGDDARIFAVRADGSLIREVEIQGAVNRDWEAITVDAQHRLWIADVGNNWSSRDDLAFYVVPEPDPMQADRSAAAERIAVYYPEQRGDDRRNFDSEAVFAADGRTYLLTKHRADTRTVLYRMPLAGDMRGMEKLGEFDVGGDPDNYGGRVTDASLSMDGQHLAVLTYHAIFIFRRPSEAGAWLSDLVKQIPLRQSRFRQCEAIAWHGADLLITNEAGQIFTVSAPL